MSKLKALKSFSYTYLLKQLNEEELITALKIFDRPVAAGERAVELAKQLAYCLKYEMLMPSESQPHRYSPPKQVGYAHHESSKRPLPNMRALSSHQVEPAIVPAHKMPKTTELYEESKEVEHPRPRPEQPAAAVRDKNYRTLLTTLKAIDHTCPMSIGDVLEQEEVDTVIALYTGKAPKQARPMAEAAGQLAGLLTKKGLLLLEAAARSKAGSPASPIELPAVVEPSNRQGRGRKRKEPAAVSALLPTECVSISKQPRKQESAASVVPPPSVAPVPSAPSRALPPRTTYRPTISMPPPPPTTVRSMAPAEQDAGPSVTSVAAAPSGSIIISERSCEVIWAAPSSDGWQCLVEEASSSVTLPAQAITGGCPFLMDSSSSTWKPCNEEVITALAVDDEVAANEVLLRDLVALLGHRSLLCH